MNQEQKDHLYDLLCTFADSRRAQEADTPFIMFSTPHEVFEEIVEFINNDLHN